MVVLKKHLTIYLKRRPLGATELNHYAFGSSEFRGD